MTIMTKEADDVIAKKDKLSRRNFLKGAAAGAAIGAVAVAGVAEITILNNQGGSSTATKTVTSTITTTATTTVAPTVTPTSVSIVTLNVNGVTRAASVDNRWSLADTLRYKFNLIGTKVGCDRGECGSCAVLVDGVPMLSCVMFAVAAQGHQITTIEGIGTPERLNSVQAALCDSDGMQCGACMAGMVVVSTAFLKANPSPTDAQLRAALSGNLCKCGNWPHILAGLKAVKS
jgi:aerobic-type carbon monoxide dehydrogenase small subunit (CoxS/CutS family)